MFEKLSQGKRGVKGKEEGNLKLLENSQNKIKKPKESER